MAALSLEALFARGDLTRLGRGDEGGEGAHAPHVLSLDWPELTDVLPDSGFPRGVVEIAAPHTLGGATRIALTAIRAAHARNPRAWCAFIDPEATLYAPGLVTSGIDLARLLVVRPSRKDLARTAVKIASARAFDVVVIDMSPLECAETLSAEKKSPPAVARTRAPIRSEILVRKLALLAEESSATVLLLSDSTAHRASPWPVALRIESSRERNFLTLHITKDRHARIGLKKTVSLARAPVSNLG